MESVGFSDISIEPQAGFFSTLILKLNYFSLRLIKGPRVVRSITRAVFSVFWYVAQHLAPLLDRLDKQWTLETPGYFVVARKTARIS